MTDSNRRHPPCKGGALPTELIALAPRLSLSALATQAQFARTGFQGGLNYYRVIADDALSNEQHSKTIDVPACFIGGASEWGVYQSPGAFQAMGKACTRLQGKHLVPDAGHSVVEEKPGPVNQLLIEFLNKAAVG